MTTPQTTLLDIASIRHTLMTGLAHNDAIAALERLQVGVTAAPQEGVSEEWRKQFWDVARALNCLPSTFPDANDHVLREAKRYAALRCLTCNGHGLVGCMTMEGGEGHECPDCHGSGVALPPGRGMVPMTEPVELATAHGARRGDEDHNFEMDGVLFPTQASFEAFVFDLSVSKGRAKETPRLTTITFDSACVVNGVPIAAGAMTTALGDGEGGK